MRSLRRWKQVGRRPKRDSLSYPLDLAVARVARLRDRKAIRDLCRASARTLECGDTSPHSRRASSGLKCSRPSSILAQKSSPNSKTRELEHAPFTDRRVSKFDLRGSHYRFWRECANSIFDSSRANFQLVFRPGGRKGTGEELFTPA